MPTENELPTEPIITPEVDETIITIAPIDILGVAYNRVSITIGSYTLHQKKDTTVSVLFIADNGQSMEKPILIPKDTMATWTEDYKLEDYVIDKLELVKI